MKNIKKLIMLALLIISAISLTAIFIQKYHNELTQGQEGSSNESAAKFDDVIIQAHNYIFVPIPSTK